jgi:hypothetical protein
MSVLIGGCSCTVLWSSVKPRSLVLLMGPTLPLRRGTFATTPALVNEGTIPHDFVSETLFALLTTHMFVSSDEPWSLAETGVAVTEVNVSFSPFFAFFADLRATTFSKNAIEPHDRLLSPLPRRSPLPAPELSSPPCRAVAHPVAYCCYCYCYCYCC